MSYRIFLTLLICALVIPAYAQKKVKSFKSQTSLASAIVLELKKGLGPKSISELKTRVRTKGQFVSYLKNKAEQCKNCPIVAEFSKNLTARRSSEIKGLNYGSHLVATAQNEEGTDPDPDLPEPGDDPDKDGDEDDDTTETSSGDDCGPFHCLTWWGEHFPCQGVPGH